MLMNLGSLASIAGSGATNITVVVFENETYEVTGAQPIPAAGRVDFAAIATASGFPNVSSYDSLDAWRANVQRTLVEPGPVFVLLRVAPLVGVPGPRSPGPARDRARRFMDALAT
jgi:thiamine pyrophosphate-dependent acetolactate synthase large subunit-like protein